MVRWVQLDLPMGDELACDVFYTCKWCGPARFRVRVLEGGEPHRGFTWELAKESCCAHLTLALGNFAFATGYKGAAGEGTA